MMAVGWERAVSLAAQGWLAARRAASVVSQELALWVGQAVSLALSALVLRAVSLARSGRALELLARPDRPSGAADRHRKRNWSAESRGLCRQPRDPR